MTVSTEAGDVMELTVVGDDERFLCVAVHLMVPIAGCSCAAFMVSRDLLRLRLPARRSAAQLLLLLLVMDRDGDGPARNWTGCCCWWCCCCCCCRGGVGGNGSVSSNSGRTVSSQIASPRANEYIDEALSNEEPVTSWLVCCWAALWWQLVVTEICADVVENTINRLVNVTRFQLCEIHLHVLKVMLSVKT